MSDIPYTEWVKALRSGNYKQTQGTLKGELINKGTGYCCLGVLADIMGYELEKEPLINEKFYADEGDWRVYKIFKENISIPNYQKLIALNEIGKSFDEIADFIENNLNIHGEL